MPGKHERDDENERLKKIEANEKRKAAYHAKKQQDAERRKAQEEDNKNRAILHMKIAKGEIDCPEKQKMHIAIHGDLVMFQEFMKSGFLDQASDATKWDLFKVTCTWNEIERLDCLLEHGWSIGLDPTRDVMREFMQIASRKDEDLSLRVVKFADIMIAKGVPCTEQLVIEAEKLGVHPALVERIRVANARRVLGCTCSPTDK